ncbi:MAG: hydrogenase maturation protease, hydrogenase 2 maturation protease [Armatimonadetes bacterium CSP1-3]|nr:MAG: hydrogenase maturation protease, hydrogenase 2 maturation protease [Armatimonadetes bacterium CSP1-3]
MFSYPPERLERVATRVLCLGNPLLADDAFGAAVAAALPGCVPPEVEVVRSEVTGFGLLDDLLNTGRLIVVDTVQTETAEPGTVYCVREGDLRTAPGPSPHYVGLFEMLALARTLRLPAPQEVVILAVEAADCITVGGAMHPAVRAAVPLIVGQVASIVGEELGSVPPTPSWRSAA